MRIIVGITGASGVIMAYYLMQALHRQSDCEIHLIISDTAKRTWEIETGIKISQLTDLAYMVHDCHNMAASISSGSFKTDGMVVIPCSMKTLSAIVNGYSEELIVRAADVCLKECRKLVLVPREMPLNRIHLKNMSEAADLGCVIIPPVLTFYNNPKTIEDHIHHIVGKILLQFGIESEEFKPWEGKNKI